MGRDGAKTVCTALLVEGRVGGCRGGALQAVVARVIVEGYGRPFGLLQQLARH